MGRRDTTSGGGRRKSKTASDLTTVEGLGRRAQEAGLEKQADRIIAPKPKLSPLERLSRGLGALNPAEALLTANEKGVVAGATKYATGIAKDVGSAITGTDYRPKENRRTFRDVAGAAGIENAWVKGGVGFLGDVVLDPSTYFGGAIAKGIGFGAKTVGNTALKGVGKVAPETEAGIRMATEGLKDAMGRAFQYGYKATTGAKTDVLSFLSKREKAKLGLATSNLARLGTGTLTQSQREELALKLIAGKRAEFTAREAGKSANEAAEAARVASKAEDSGVQKLIDDQATRSKSFAEGAGVENPYETYFPFLKADKVQKFVMESRGVQVGSEAYRKQFKNLLTNDAIELDPAKAFFTRESQIVSDRMTRDFLEGFVGKYGKPLTAFKTSDEAEKAGFSLIREKGIFGKELGYAPSFDAKLLRDSISPEFQSIDMIAKATGYDAMTSLFKRAVTGLFVPFHVRNFVSGHIQNFEVLGAGALNPKAIAAGQKIALIMAKGDKLPSGTITVAGQEMKFAKAIKPFVERFSGDTFYNADFQTALKYGGELKSAAKVFSKDRIKETVKTAGLGTEAIPFKVARAVGQYIEHQQKATAYLVALEQGRSVKQALELAERAGFDYRALTRFESQIMRRLVPFYSFTRKNLELQLRTLGESPQRINQILSFFENVGEPLTPEERENLPGFVKDVLGARLEDTPEGLKQYITGFGTPIEAFTFLMGENPVFRSISQMNPLLKVPLELGIGKDSFRQKDIKDVYNAQEYSLAPQIVKDLLEIKEVQKDVLKEKGGKLVKVGERTEYVANPERLLIARALFTSRGVTYLDQLFDDDLKGFVKLLKTTTGVKPTQIDLEQQKSLKERDKERELEDLLVRNGEVQRFQKVYDPKK